MPPGLRLRIPFEWTSQHNPLLGPRGPRWPGKGDSSTMEVHGFSRALGLLSSLQTAPSTRTPGALALAVLPINRLFCP